MKDHQTDIAMSLHDIDAAQCWVVHGVLTSWRAAAGDGWQALVAPSLQRWLDAPGGEPAASYRRAMAADWLLRTAVPAWLRTAALDEEARELASLPEMTTDRELQAAEPSISAALSSLDSAWAESITAVAGAPRYCSSTLNVRLAQFAAEAAARTAMGRSGSEACVAILDRDGAGDILLRGFDAALSAAQMAAWLGIWWDDPDQPGTQEADVARHAAGRLEATVSLLQRAAVGLLERMVTAGEGW